MGHKIDIPSQLTQSALTPQEECLEVPMKKRKLFIGIPKETAFQENRIALTPASVRIMVNAGDRIILESGAGLGAGFSDFEYSEAGAEIAQNPESVYESSVLVKVAPPSIEEVGLCHPGQILISPIHLPTLSDEYIYRLKEKRVTALAMEYMKDESGMFPFVRMISEMAGISAMQTAANLLSKTSGGSGILLGGIAGVPPAKVVIMTKNQRLVQSHAICYLFECSQCGFGRRGTVAKETDMRCI